MSLVERHEFAIGPVPPAPAPDALRVVTLGPGEEDWAVVDDRGGVAYVGPALFAARYAANVLR